MRKHFNMHGHDHACHAFPFMQARASLSWNTNDYPHMFKYSVKTASDPGVQVMWGQAKGVLEVAVVHDLVGSHEKMSKKL